MRLSTRFLILAASACSAALAVPALASGPQVVHVQVKAPFLTGALKLASSLGKTTKVDRAKGTFDLILKDGQTPRNAAAKLWGDRAIYSVTGAGLPAESQDRGSLHYLDQVLSKFDVERPRLGHYDEEEDDAKGNPDYLRALKYFTDRRAYPFDRVDWSAYGRAHDHAARMTPAYWLGAGSSTSTGGIGKIRALAADPLTASWSFIGPKNLDVPYRTYYGVRPVTGRTNAVAFDPSHPGTYYLGGAEGGVWKSTDSGTTWTSLSKNWAVQCVGAITIDPNDSNTIYVGTGDQHGYLNFSEGVEKSTDGGRTWTLLGKSTFGSSPVTGIAVNPNNSQQVVVTCGFNGGIYRSSDGGQTWSLTEYDDGWSFYDLSQGLPATTGGTPPLYAVDGNLWRSTDFGQTWTQVNSTGRDGNGYGYWSVAASKTSKTTVYVLDNSTNQILKSANSGTSFSDTTNNFNSVADWGQSWYDYYLRCSNHGGHDELFCGLISVADSDDGGATWTDIGKTETSGALTHNDAHCLAVSPSNPNQLLIGNDGGVFGVNRSGSTWAFTPLNQGGLGLTMFYHAAWSKQNANVMLGGSQDNATPVATGDLANWGNMAGGDGGGVAIDAGNDQVQYATVYDFDIIQTTDGWNSENDISPSSMLGDNLPFVTPIFGDPVDGDLVYGCTNYLWRWDNSTSSWTSHLGGLKLTSGSLVNTLGVAPSNNSVIYTGSDSGDVYFSKNQGSSWTKINTSSLPNRAVTSISVNPTNPYDVLVGLSGTGTSHLMRCSNTNVSSPTWSSIAGSGGSALPDISLNCIERDPSDAANTIYVGTDIGVFATNNGGTTWYNATIPLGLPSVQVNDLSVTPFGVLNAATYGRGMWQIHLTSTSNLAATTVNVLVGTQTGGNVSSLSADDGNLFSVQDAAVPSLGNESSIRVGFQMPSGKTPTVMKVSFKAIASHNGPVQVLVYNPSRRRYIYAGMASSGKDVIVQLPGNAAQYVDTTGHVYVVLRTILAGESSSVTSTVGYDHINLVQSSY